MKTLVVFDGVVFLAPIGQSGCDIISLTGRKNLQKREKIALRQEESRMMIQHFKELAVVVQKGGGSVSFEWPRESIGWNQDFVISMITELGLFAVQVDGCAMGVQDEKGKLI